MCLWLLVFIFCPPIVLWLVATSALLTFFFRDILFATLSLFLCLIVTVFCTDSRLIFMCCSFDSLSVTCRNICFDFLCFGCIIWSSSCTGVRVWSGYFGWLLSVSGSTSSIISWLHRMELWTLFTVISNRCSRKYSICLILYPLHAETYVLTFCVLAA